MDGICKIKNKDDWVVFDNSFNEILTPQIINFLSNFSKIKFGGEFNQTVDISDDDSPTGKSSILPNSITHLSFSGIFNQKVDISDEDSPTGKSSILPESLTYLEFGGSFEQSVTYQTESSQNGKSPTLLPNSLTDLKLGYFFNLPILVFPTSLKRIIIPSEYPYYIPDYIEVIKYFWY